MLEQLQTENARLRQEKAQLREKNQRLQMQNLKGRVAKDGHNSSKPPSSDGSAKKARNLRKKSGKEPGGQVGHRRSALSLVETPDKIIILCPLVCACCQTSLQETPAQSMEWPQEIDLPPIMPVACPRDQHVPRGTLPNDQLQRDASAVLQFLNDLRVPFTNNSSEQDLRISVSFSRKSLAPFAVRLASPPSVASTPTSPLWLNKAIISVCSPASKKLAFPLPAFCWSSSPSAAPLYSYRRT